MKVKELIALIETDGWVQFHHPTKHGTVTVAGKLNIEIPPATLSSALK